MLGTNFFGASSLKWTEEFLGVCPRCVMTPATDASGRCLKHDTRPTLPILSSTSTPTAPSPPSAELALSRLSVQSLRLSQQASPSLGLLLLTERYTMPAKLIRTLTPIRGLSHAPLCARAPLRAHPSGFLPSGLPSGLPLSTRISRTLSSVPHFNGVEKQTAAHLKFDAAQPTSGAMPRAPPTPRDVDAEVAAVEKWWASERWAHTERNYSAFDVVQLRGGLNSTFAAGEMSNKFWETLQLCKAHGGHSRTFGALDPVQAWCWTQY